MPHIFLLNTAYLQGATHIPAEYSLPTGGHTYSCRIQLNYRGPHIFLLNTAYLQGATHIPAEYSLPTGGYTYSC